MLTNLFKCSHLYRIREIKKYLKELVPILNDIPDFTLELYVKVGSFVPFIDRITPDDTITIYKKGRNLRIDYTLVGYAYLQSKRRKMSCILQHISK